MKLNRPEEEMTFCMVKPDGVTRGLIGEVVRRFEQRGLKIIAMEMVQPTHEEMDAHYPKDEAIKVKVLDYDKDTGRIRLDFADRK